MYPNRKRNTWSWRVSLCLPSTPAPAGPNEAATSPLGVGVFLGSHV